MDLDQFDNSYIRDLRSQFAETGRRLWALDVTSDLGDSKFYRGRRTGSKTVGKIIEFGSGAHFDARIAMLRALTE